MPEISSTYNFVPVCDRVFEPDLIDGSYIDVPFKDGLSGTIKVRAEATTPIFVRGSGLHPEGDERGAQGRVLEEWQRKRDGESGAKHQQFYRLPDAEGRYALPGTTVKGMLRNILEVASFSRLSGVENRRYGVRDLRNRDRSLYMDWMTTRGAPHASKPNAGWLTFEENQWWITPCELARVELSALKSYYEHVTSDRFPRELLMGKPAGRRYDQWSIARNVRFKIRPMPNMGWPSSNGPRLAFDKVDDTSLRSADDDSRVGELEGEIVLTGQPQNNFQMRSPGKHREFVFHTPRPEGRRRVPNRIFEDFEFIHSETSGKPNEEWRYWLNQVHRFRAGHPAPRVPVFYLAYDCEQHTPETDTVSIDHPDARLHSFGLALMYRLAYKYRVVDALPAGHRLPAPDASQRDEPPLDFAETLFGAVRRGKSLRGRVQCEPLVATNDSQPIRDVDRDTDYHEAVLNGPKPTFYPSYLEQPADNSGRRLERGRNYQTFMKEDARLRGWKRYPVRSDGENPERNDPPGNNHRVSSFFRPLDRGACFEGIIHFHNLRPWELGALLWAIRFGQHDLAKETPYRHSVGLAKPLGFGAVKLSVDALSAVSEMNEPRAVDFDVAMTEFERQMNQWLASIGLPLLSQTEQVRELLLMANQQQTLDTSRLRYPSPVGMFADFKANRKVLQRYSELLGQPRARRGATTQTQRPTAPPSVHRSSRSDPPKNPEDLIKTTQPFTFIKSERVKKKLRLRFECRVLSKPVAATIPQMNWKGRSELKESETELRFKILGYDGNSFQIGNQPEPE